MGTINSYKDLIVWQNNELAKLKFKWKMQNYSSKIKSDLKSRCYFFSLELIQLIDSLPKK